MRKVKSISRHPWSIWLLVAVCLLAGCGRDQSEDSPNAWIESRADQYRTAATSDKKAAGDAEGRPQYDVQLEEDQRIALESVVASVRANLSVASGGGAAPEITHLPIKTGAPDHLLMVNLWFTGQLEDDDAPWNYELTLIWQDDAWTPFGGTAQQQSKDGLPQGRELDGDFVLRLIGGA